MVPVGPNTTAMNRLLTFVSTLVLLYFSLPAAGQGPQLISLRDPSQPPPAGGGGDSWEPIVSPDARYVLFASSANNLWLATNKSPMPARIPGTLNVFLRDRTNASTTLVSVNLSGVAGGNGDSWPVALSTNGQYVLFESNASDLVPGDTNAATDVFVRDLINARTVLVSVSTNGGVGNGASASSTMTPDGRYVAFASAANNLAAGDSNRISDVFIRDLQADLTVLASVGTLSTNSGCRSPDISADGRYVAFYGGLTNAFGTVGSVIYVRDLVGGATIWASDYARTALASNSVFAFNHALSANGQYLAYEASAGSATAGVILRYNLGSGISDIVHTNAAVPAGPFEDIRSLDISPDGRFIAFVANTNGTTGATTCVELWDGLSGDLALVSGDAGGFVQSNSLCYWPAVDPSGRFVAFLSTATNLVPNQLAGDYHLYLRDTIGGSTSLLDADTNDAGSPVSAAAVPSFTPDFRFVAFECADASLVPNDRNRDYDVFLRDLAAGTNELISAHDPNLPSLTPNGPSTISLNPVSSNGQLIAFASEADNLVPNDTNGCRDVFVRDLVNGTTTIVSAATNGYGADGPSFDPAISPDGRYVAFTSRADNLVAGDTNKALDVFVRDLESGSTTLVSVNTNGTGPGNFDSFAPVISSGGRYVLFRSRAANLAPGSFTSMSENLFLADLEAPATYALTTGGDMYDFKLNFMGAMTPDGRFVAFGANPASLYVWDTVSAARIYTNTLGAQGYGLAISAAGNRMAFALGILGYSVVAVDLGTRTSSVVETNSSGVGYLDLRLSADGRFLSCVKYSNTNYQVYLFDLQAKTNLLVSQSDTTSAGANGISDSPRISPDGRFVAYHSAATNIVAGDINGLPDIFLFDRLSGTTVLVSDSQLQPSSANNRSSSPVFTADSSTLFFASLGSDLSADDFNHYSDVFAVALATPAQLPAFLVTVLPPASGQNTWLTWPGSPGGNYQAQFKNNLDDLVWKNLKGGIIWFGDQAFFQDPNPSPSVRFYRVIAF